LRRILREFLELLLSIRRKIYKYLGKYDRFSR
jgi:hypothetical protein